MTDVGNTIIDDLRYNYDVWRNIELNKMMKRAGIGTAIQLIISLIMGLSLGLKQLGCDIVRASKRADKLNPAKKKIEIVKWTGKSLIFLGDHIYLVIGLTLLYVYTRNRK